MARAANGRVWKLALGILLALVVAEVGREIVVGVEKPAAPVKKPEPTHTYDPAFHKGDPAPDFTLPDRDGKLHHLAELVHRDTLLFFTCGCTRCMDLATYTSNLRRRMGAKAPDVIVVTSMPKEVEKQWRGRVRMPQTILYEKADGPANKEYYGHPCPRVYRLNGDRTVAWIAPSPVDLPSLHQLGDRVAMNLGFRPESP